MAAVVYYERTAGRTANQVRISYEQIRRQTGCRCIAAATSICVETGSKRQRISIVWKQRIHKRRVCKQRRSVSRGITGIYVAAEVMQDRGQWRCPGAGCVAARRSCAKVTERATASMSDVQLQVLLSQF